MEKLPSGIMPTDNNIEIFANPKEFGKCFWISKGVTRSFWELPLPVLDDLRDELLSDIKAISGFRLMGITDTRDMLEHYNYCNRGKFDGTPDISESGRKTREFIDCGRKGKCPGECRVCSPLEINGERITFREFDCMKCMGTGVTTCEELIVALGFKSYTAVNSLAKRVREKLGCKNTAEIVYKVKELGLV